MATILSTRHPKAKKDHCCDWCGEKINKGTEYVLTTLICDDNGTYAWKNHKHCEDLFDKLNMLDNDFGYGVDMDCFLDSVSGFLSDKLTSEEYDDVYDTDAEIKTACELLGIEYKQ